MRKNHAWLSHLLLLTIGVSATTSVAFSLSMFYGMSFLSNLTFDSKGNTTLNTTGETPVLILENTDTESNKGKTQGSSSSSSSSSSSDPSNGNSDTCVLRISKCAATEMTCLEAPTFQKTSCNDSKCTEGNNICLPIGNTTNFPTVSTDSSGKAPASSQDPSGSGKQNASSTATTVTTQIQVNGPQTVLLGCFTVDGNWTTDRSACDSDQRRHLADPFNGQANSSSEQQVSSVTNAAATSSVGQQSGSPSAAQTEVDADQQDSGLQQQLQQLFISDSVRTTIVNNLLATASNALERLQNVQKENLPTDAATSVQDTQIWISQLITDVSSTQMSIDQLEGKGGELKSRLQDTMQTIAAALPSAAQKRPDTVLQKMDHLFAVLPGIFSYLQTQGVTVSLDTTNAYQTAGGLYSTAKPSCIADANQCAKLQDVLNALGTMRDDISLSLNQAGKNDLQGQIDLMMQ